MSQSCNERCQRQDASERGGSRLSFLIVVLIIVAVSYVGYQYVPVAYQASLYKVYMQDTVNNAAVTAKNSDWVMGQLRTGLKDYSLPPEALVKTGQRDGRLEAHVQFSRPIQLPGYVFQYTFDHTVTSNAILASDN